MLQQENTQGPDEVQKFVHVVVFMKKECYFYLWLLWSAGFQLEEWGDRTSEGGERNLRKQILMEMKVRRSLELDRGNSLLLEADIKDDSQERPRWVR